MTFQESPQNEPKVIICWNLELNVCERSFSQIQLNIPYWLLHLALNIESINPDVTGLVKQVAQNLADG